MNDELTLLEDAASRFFAERVSRDLLDSAERGEWPSALWQDCSDMGYLQPVEPATFWRPAEAAMLEYTLLSVSGRHAVPLPIVEMQIASGLLARAGATIPSGPIGLMLRVGDAVPWGRCAKHVVMPVDDAMGLGDLDFRAIRPQRNIAGEARDIVLERPQCSIYPMPVRWQRVAERAALMRAAQMVGAIERCLEMAVSYAQERKQFGRPIGAFQAIQHQLAQLAGQAALAKMAVLAGYDALAQGVSEDHTGFAAAVAKSRASEAAGAACAIAHQVHGAMGFTHEHALQFYTRRLQAWRSEYGNERHWNTQLGLEVLRRGADAMWPLLSGTA
jgi:alkylation response protein AidB-like acyl-CoA dehydrogenase